MKLHAPLWALIATSTVVAAGCSAGGETLASSKSGSPGMSAAVPVAAGMVVQKPMPITVEVVGTAEAYSTVAIRAQVTGELTAVHFKDGDDVAKGQLLFGLDQRPLEAALAQAEANLQRDLAQAANARSQTERYRDLAQRGIATKEQLEQQTTNAAALDATVAADRAAVANAEVQLTYATIASPLSGRTGKLMVHPGNLVRANDTAPLVVINQIAPLHVSFGVPEAQLPEFRRALSQHPLEVEARPPNDPAPPSRGRVSFIDNAVDQTSGTIEIRGTFPNEDRRLWPGQFVNVTVTLGIEPNATVVASSAVQNGQQGQFVFVAKPDNTVELRPIQVSRTAGAETIVRSGVKAGETVVTEGQLRLIPGSRIAIKPREGEKP
ncbi:MAG TPA: efflux RND transporter periplasmic adaptor subunit [Vicinamibacterales bacterium]|jgi:membrane fusion protein, multidrug efflux system|nr:efflux RND transporter periplasmic adaptor subunit [Vicinamibacterales bacterium]